jgi:hypothetical protein
MFDILSTIGVTASAALVVAFLAHAMAQTTPGRLTVAAALTVWFALVVAIGATGALDPVHGIGVAGLGITVALPVLALVGSTYGVPSIRAALSATPVPTMIALNVFRVLGALFIVLYANGRLPAPFAPSAGWGDIFAGVTALPVALALLRFGAGARTLALLWNVIGLADLVVALALGSLSALGPLQVFVGPPDSGLMVTLPWLLIPGFLVPALIFVHVVIFQRLVGVETSAAGRWVHAAARAS